MHLVLALFLGAIVGGFLGGLGFDVTQLAFQNGLAGGTKIVLSYALLGAIAMAVVESGLPNLLAHKLNSRMKVGSQAAVGQGDSFPTGGAQHAEAAKTLVAPKRAVAITKRLMLAGLLLAIFVSYRRPRKYEDLPIEGAAGEPEISAYRLTWTVIAIVAVFAI